MCMSQVSTPCISSTGTSQTVLVKVVLSGAAYLLCRLCSRLRRLRSQGRGTDEGVLIAAWLLAGRLASEHQVSYTPAT